MIRFERKIFKTNGHSILICDSFRPHCIYTAQSDGGLTLVGWCVRSNLVGVRERGVCNGNLVCRVIMITAFATAQT